jgi:hypothetical protein
MEDYALNLAYNTIFNESQFHTGKQIPIKPSITRLFPTVSLWEHVSVEANFGDNLAKHFKYDVEKCPGLFFD